MASCSARGCANNSQTTPNLSFFRCPNDPELSGQWILESGKQYMLGKSVAECSEKIWFCGQHFESCMFTDERREELLPDAIPTLFDAPPRISSKEKSLQPSRDEKCGQAQHQLMEGNIPASKRAKVNKFMFRFFQYFFMYKCIFLRLSITLIIFF